MRKIHRVALAEHLKKIEINSRDFRPSEAISNALNEETDTYTLEYKNSGILITFFQSPKNTNQYGVVFTKYNRKRTYSALHDYTNFDSVLSIFSNWIDHQVKPYVEDNDTTDPFTPHEEPFTFFYEATAEDSEKFSDAEIQLFDSKLKELQIFIESRFTLQAEQISLIQNTLNNLSNATKTETKSKWKELFNQGILTIVKVIFQEAIRGGVSFFINFFNNPNNFDSHPPSNLLA